MPELFLPVKDFDLTSKVEDLNKSLTAIQEDAAHTRSKVDMLNDWHNEVNLKFEKINGRFDKQDLNLAWILRLAMLGMVVAFLDKVPITSLIPLVSKLLGG